MNLESFSKVENFPNLIRDNKTNAILNTDSREYENYIRNKTKINSQKQHIKNLESEICELKNSIDEIKQLLGDLKNGS
jgi:peptidoglycan hydrolase CwlO-like protein